MQINRTLWIIRTLCYVSPLLLLLGCSWLEPHAGSGVVLYQDDFSRPGSGWDRYRDDIYEANYIDGTYRINVFASETEVWARPHLNLSDVHIEVIATKMDGPDDNLFGVICRYQNAQNFYYFAISSDGYVGIGMHKDGEETLLSSDTMQPVSVVQPGETHNLIRAVCAGEQLRLHVNGVLVASARGDDWDEGDVGLIVGTYNQPGVEVEFDNFSVLKP